MPTKYNKCLRFVLKVAALLLGAMQFNIIISSRSFAAPAALFQAPPTIETNSDPHHDERKRDSSFDDHSKVSSELEAETAAAELTGVSSVLVFKEESWHFVLGIGVGYPIYGEAGQQLGDAVQNESGTHMPLRFDVSGYWPVPLGRMRMQGITMNGFIDNVSRTDGSAETQFQVGQMLLGYSTMLFLSETLGQGWLVRGDAGLAIMNWSESVKTQDFIVRTQQDASVGLGAVIGGGYAFDPFKGGPHTMLMTTVGYNRSASSLIGPVSAWVLGLNGSILF